MGFISQGESLQRTMSVRLTPQFLRALSRLGGRAFYETIPLMTFNEITNPKGIRNDLKEGRLRADGREIPPLASIARSSAEAVKEDRTRR